MKNQSRLVLRFPPDHWHVHYQPEWRVLLMQLIYQGKTNHCNPAFKFPAGFHIYHIKNDLSNEEKCKETLKEILM